MGTLTGRGADGPGTGGRGTGAEVAVSGEPSVPSAGRLLEQALARRPGGPLAAAGRSSVVDALRPRAAGVPAPAPRRVSLAQASAAPARLPRLVFALDATASRERAWAAARQVTDSLFGAAPGGIEVALAVHGGGRMTAFGGFHRDVGALRDEAAGISCEPGPTRMLDIVRESLRRPGVRAMVYIGDCFEEDESAALALAGSLRLRGTKLVVLQDESSGTTSALRVFRAMAGRTGGIVLPFDAGSLDPLRDALGAVASYVAGGRDMLRVRSLASPAARLLLGRDP